MPDLKDLIVAILGASVALAGLLLVFSGFLFSQAASFSSDAPDTAIRSFENAARLAMVPFALSLLIALISILYWFISSRLLVIIIVGGFSFDVIGTIVYGIWVVRKL